MPSIDLTSTDQRKRASLTRSKSLSLETTLLLGWFVINLVIGLLTVREYGLSIDEPNNYRYSKNTLESYPSLFGILYEPIYRATFDGHGPAFVALAGIPIRIIRNIFPNVFAPDLWHFSYFITFQLTGLCLYWLVKRWFSTWTAWGILILFSTQPMLLGHAFMNPKDIPFTFFLTLSVALGFRLADGMEAKESSISLEGTAATLVDRFRASDAPRKRKFFTFLVLALVITLILVLFSSQIDSLISQVVVFFYSASPASWAGRLFGAVASHASNISEEDYVNKALRLFRRLELGILNAGIVFLLAYFSLLLANTTLSALLSKTWMQRHRLGKFTMDLVRSLRSFLHREPLKAWFAEFFRELRNPRLILAGVALGLATAVRAIGPLAGVIVFLALLAKVRSRAWTTGIAYFLITGIVTYIAWPRLWDAPIPRYLEGLGVISNFSTYAGRVLFNGRLHVVSDLPRSYLPVLLNIQFTETLLLCLYIGLVVLVWRLLRSRQRTDLLLYIGLGFVFPLAGLILLKPPLYHNLRQVLFFVPAMFMLAAFALDLIFSKITRNWARVLLIVAIALPGVYSSITLFPYEYVYYNSLVGGVAGVRNRYELDYWRTALRETALYLNEIAPHGSRVLVTRSAGLFEEYARPDLILDKVSNNSLDPNAGYDYVVQVARWDAWDLYPEAEIVFAVERQGAVLATVKALQDAALK